MTIKEKIIYHCIDSNFDKARALIKEYAKEMRINIRHTARKDINEALKAFIDNGSGYNETIPNLYNSIKKRCNTK